jgi:hypothetical protein
MLCSLFWISPPLKLGLRCCAETSMQSYRSALRNISEEHRSHVMGDAGLGLAAHGQVWHGPFHHVQT